MTRRADTGACVHHRTRVRRSTIPYLRTRLAFWYDASALEAVPNADEGLKIDGQLDIDPARNQCHPLTSRFVHGPANTTAHATMFRSGIPPNANAVP